MTDRALHAQRLGEVDSTQRLAMEQLRRGWLKPGQRGVIVAASQTNGVGRFDRPWVSPRGGLWCTFVIPLESPLLSAGLLGLRIGLACVSVVRALAPEIDPERIRLKWPNDVLFDDRKILGVLIERIVAAQAEFLAIGVGLNANFDPSLLPEVLQSSAATLRSKLGRDVDLEHVLAALGAAFEPARLASASPQQVVTMARTLLHGIGHEQSVTLPTGERMVATLIGLDPAGQVVFEQDGSRWSAPPSIQLG